MAGYVRNDTTNNIADGNIINASDLDGEFDSIQSAFVNTTGHTHDGTAAEGAPITKIGPAQDVVASATDLKPKTNNTVDLGTSSLRYKNIYAAGTAFVATLDLTNALAVADGGTGATTLTGVVKGNGTSAFTAGNVNLASEVSGTLPVANGGTGAATFTANNVLLGNGTSAFQVVAPGTNGNILTSNGTTWTSAAPASVSLTTGVTGTLPVTNGGTGLSTFAALSLPVANTLNTLTALTATAGQSVRVNAGGTAWEAYTPSTGTGDVVCPASATADSLVAFNGTTGKLVKQASTVTVAQGGTGATTLTGVLKGNGTSAFTAATANTDYLVPALANTAVTGFKTATFNSQTTIATTSGSITVDWTAAQNQRQTEPTGTITYTFTAPPGPCHLQLLIDSDGTSTAQTINWPGTVIFLGSTWAGANNKRAVLNFWYDGTNYFAIGTNQV
jgi:hypothetical protein